MNTITHGNITFNADSAVKRTKEEFIKKHSGNPLLKGMTEAKIASTLGAIWDKAQGLLAPVEESTPSKPARKQNRSLQAPESTSPTE